MSVSRSGLQPSVKKADFKACNLLCNYFHLIGLVFAVAVRLKEQKRSTGVIEQKLLASELNQSEIPIDEITWS